MGHSTGPQIRLTDLAFFPTASHIFFNIIPNTFFFHLMEQQRGSVLPPPMSENLCAEGKEHSEGLMMHEENLCLYLCMETFPGWSSFYCLLGFF